MSNEGDVDEYWQTHIYAPDKEYETLASVESDSPEVEHAATRKGDTRALILTQGGDVVDGEELTPDRPFLSQHDDEVNLSRTVVYDAGVAVGYYAHHLETHGLAEDRVWDQFAMLASEHEFPLGQYLDFHGTLTERQRRLRLMDLLEFRIGAGDWAAEPYLDAGSWRSTDLSESGEKLADEIARNIDLNPKHCYRNAQQAAIQHKDNHRVSYVEGIALPKNGSQVSRHAWIEIDGEVAELTWPWHFYDGEEAVYFGTEFDKDEVAETFDRRNGGSQMILSDSQIADLNQIHANEV